MSIQELKDKLIIKYKFLKITEEWLDEQISLICKHQELSNNELFLEVENKIIEKYELEEVKEADLDLDELSKNLPLTSAVDQYLKEIGMFKLLTPEEEKALAYRIKAGDTKAKQDFINANLRLVVNISKKYSGRGVELLDLISEGNIGLMMAVDRFDVTKGFKFSTYAIWWIKQSIIRSIYIKGRAIRLPVHLAEEVTKLNYVEQKLILKLNRVPSYDEVAEVLSIPTDQVKKLYKVRDLPLSLEMPVGEEDTTLMSFLEDDTNIEDEVLNKISREDLLSFIKMLPERDRDIIKMRYGILNEKPMTLDLIGKKYGITRERVRQLENKALNRLKYAARTYKPLKEHYQEWRNESSKAISIDRNLEEHNNQKKDSLSKIKYENSNTLSEWIPTRVTIFTDEELQRRDKILTIKK